MIGPTLFDPRPPDPGDDAAPSGNGAGAKNKNSSPDPTRLPLMPPAQHNAPAGTSDVAAKRIAGHAAKQRADVLHVIETAGAAGATDAEIELVVGMRAQSLSPRRGELVKMGLVVDSGQRRKTPRGRPAAVWVTPNHVPKSTAEINGASESHGTTPEGPVSRHNPGNPTVVFNGENLPTTGTMASQHAGKSTVVINGGTNSLGVLSGSPPHASPSCAGPS